MLSITGNLLNRAAPKVGTSVGARIRGSSFFLGHLRFPDVDHFLPDPKDPHCRLAMLYEVNTVGVYDVFGSFAECAYLLFPHC